ncbi:MAG: hypothetical protein ABEJ89_08750 [Haloarculaceae archaeon]
MVTERQPTPSDDAAIPDGALAEREPVAGSLADAPLEVDDLFEVLCRPDNRYVLTYLLMTDEPVSYHDLVEFVVDRTETPESLTKGEYRGRVLTRFLHSTFPKLAERGLLEYDRDDQMLVETEYTALALPYLRVALLQQDVGLD